jgi:hypothetical protein
MAAYFGSPNARQTRATAAPEGQVPIAGNQIVAAAVLVIVEGLDVEQFGADRRQPG